MIRFSDIRILYLRELRAALRERNIVINTILLPVFLYPLLLWITYTGITFVFGQTEGFVSRVMIRGAPERIQPLRAELERESHIELTRSHRPESDVRSGDLDLLLEILPPERPAGADTLLSGNFKVRLTYDESKDRSRTAHTRITDLLSGYRAGYLEKQGERLGLTKAQYQRVWVEMNNVATGRQMGQFILGMLSPILLIVMTSLGGMHAAIDSTAGEREKSTWETLMTAATSRTNILVAKYLYVATMASVAGVLNFAAMLFSMKSVMAPIMGDRLDDLAFAIPWRSVPLILSLTVLLALFIAAGMMILASFARTFKEGQSMVSPFYIAILLPIMFLQVPGIEFTLGMAAIPIINVCMVFREAITGVYHWPQIGLTVLVELGGIALLLGLAARILRYEDFLLGSYGGNLGKFFKERILGRTRPTGGRA